jgi:hypothetical protein
MALRCTPNLDTIEVREDFLEEEEFDQHLASQVPSKSGMDTDFYGGMGQQLLHRPG